MKARRNESSPRYSNPHRKTVPVWFVEYIKSYSNIIFSVEFISENRILKLQKTAHRYTTRNKRE